VLIVLMLSFHVLKEYSSLNVLVL